MSEKLGLVLLHSLDCLYKMKLEDCLNNIIRSTLHSFQFDKFNFLIERCIFML